MTKFTEFASCECNLRAFFDYLKARDVSTVNWIADRPLSDGHLQLQTLYVKNEWQMLVNVCKLRPGTHLQYSSEDIYMFFKSWCKHNGKMWVDATVFDLDYAFDAPSFMESQVTDAVADGIDD